MRVSIRKCKNCRRYHGYCPLADLEPCSYLPIDPNKEAKDIFLAIVTIIGCIGVGIAILLACHKEVEVEKTEPISTISLLHKIHKDELTEWDKLVMAIAYTESRFNEGAIGKSQDFGILQLTPIYVKEVNRLNGTEYNHSDALDPSLSLEMFRLMQDKKNPNRDLNLAIYMHNKSPEYKKKVMESLDFINKYETFRTIVKK